MGALGGTKRNVRLHSFSQIRKLSPDRFFQGAGSFEQTSLHAAGRIAARSGDSERGKSWTGARVSCRKTRREGDDRDAGKDAARKSGLHKKMGSGGGFDRFK